MSGPLKNLLSRRLRKKVRIQGGARIFDGYPARRETYFARTLQRHTHRPDGYPERQRGRWAFFGSLLDRLGGLGTAGDEAGRQDADFV